jgi:hypothetical protein
MADAKGYASVTRTFMCKPEYGDLKKDYFTIALGDGGYKTGGYDCSLSTYGIGTILMVYLPPHVQGFVPEYVSGKLKFYYQAAFTNGADGPLIEIPDTTATLNDVEIKFAVEGKS